MAVIQKRIGKDGRIGWRALIRIKPHPPVSKTFRTKSNAERWASATETAIHERRYFPEREAMRHTLRDLMGRFKSRIEKDRVKKKAGQIAQANWFADEAGDLLLAELTSVKIADLREKLSKDKAPGTVNRYLAVLSRALNLAVREWGWLTDSPMRNFERMKEPQGRIRFLSDDERTRLLNFCKEQEYSHLYDVVLLALSTGMRQGEILGLTWSQVDLERGWILLEKTKNQDRRGIPLVGPALEAIKSRSERRTDDESLLFPPLRGEGLASIRKAWNTTLVKAEIPNFKFHDLRHSAASTLLMSGASLGEIADVLGHRTLAMVKRYSHIADEHRAKVLERMSRHMFGGAGDVSKK